MVYTANAIADKRGSRPGTKLTAKHCRVFDWSFLNVAVLNRLSVYPALESSFVYQFPAPSRSIARLKSESDGESFELAAVDEGRILLLSELREPGFKTWLVGGHLFGGRVWFARGRKRPETSSAS